MQSIIRFSLFGDYERFSTSKFDTYTKLIDFFGKRGYTPAAINELQLQPNGQSRVLVMPFFLNDMGSKVEITSDRINFQKNVNSIAGIEMLKGEFANEFSELMDVFINDMSIEANRVALNCDILEENITFEMPTQSTYYDDADKTEMSIRNVARKKVENEVCNIVIEKCVNILGGFTKYSYDINSIAENTAMRFKNNNIMKMYRAYIDIAIEIEKGLK